MIADGGGNEITRTRNRKGLVFSTFLGRLRSETSVGTRMPNAWVAIAPQGKTNGPRIADRPVMIFVAGRGGVKLFS
jgi:hypothetical protein